MAKKQDNQMLERFGTVYTKPGQLGRAYRQDENVSGILNHFERSQRKSFLVVGASGVGKTALLHQVFRSLLGDEKLPWTIVKTSTTELMTGTKYLGEWQTRVTQLMGLAKARQRTLIYFTDVHNLRGAGRSDNDDSNMAEAFAPAIESGKIVVVGECTSANFRAGIEAVPVLARQFTLFKLREMNEAETSEIVRACFAPIAAAFEKKRESSLVLEESALSSLTNYADIFFPNEVLPGAAVRLLGHVVTRCKENLDGAAPAGGPVTIDPSDIVQTLQRFTGIPRQLLDDSVRLDPGEVKKFFDSRVVGQSEAVTTVMDLITLIKAGLTDPGKPLSVMLFSGPTGVGKTELAKALAEFLFGSPERMIRCDMSEYKDAHAFERLVGERAGGRHSGAGSLIAKVREQPFSVVLFDEVEKAHPNVFDVLLQAFDDGRLTDPAGDTTNLTQTIMILTSNLGGDLAAAPAMGFGSEGIDLASQTQAELRKFFRPEFLNRIDHIIGFKPLGREETRILARRELGKAVLRSGLKRRELRVDIEPAVIDLLVKQGFSPLYGARPLKRAVEKHALLPVARQIVQMGGEARGALLRLSVKKGAITARVVKDRQARTAARISRGVEIEDPVSADRERVGPAQIDAELGGLGKSVEELEQRVLSDKLAERKSELVGRSGEADFWDDQVAARQTLGEIYRIERLLDAIGKIRHRYTELVAGIAGLRRERDEAKLAEMVAHLRAASQHAELLRYGIECRSAEERRDALVALFLVGDAPDGIDLPAKLAGSYINWARRKGYDVGVIHEERAESAGSPTREVVVEIAGPAAFGILRAEEGMHEFVASKTGGHPRREFHVSVRVLGVMTERERREGESVATRTSAARKRDSAFGEPIRTRASASLKNGDRSVDIMSPLAADEAAEAASSLLLAELRRDSDESAEIVRKYTLSPKPSVKDPQAPKSAVKLKDFWDGEIDLLLRAGIQSRHQPSA
ncbi:MAG: AAA family ATPase [Verrucomicrobiales bacterium]